MKVVIWKASIYNISFIRHAIPGHFLFNQDNGLVVACGDGDLLVEEVEFLD